MTLSASAAYGSSSRVSFQNRPRWRGVPLVAPAIASWFVACSAWVLLPRARSWGSRGQSPPVASSPLGSKRRRSRDRRRHPLDVVVGGKRLDDSLERRPDCRDPVSLSATAVERLDDAEHRSDEPGGGRERSHQPGGFALSSYAASSRSNKAALILPRLWSEGKDLSRARLETTLLRKRRTSRIWERPRRPARERAGESDYRLCCMPRTMRASPASRPRPGPPRRERSRACGRRLRARVRVGDPQRCRLRGVNDCLQQRRTSTRAVVGGMHIEHIQSPRPCCSGIQGRP